MIRVFNQYVSLKTYLLILLEDLLFAAGLICAARLRFMGNTPEFHDFIRFPFVLQGLVIVCSFQLCFYYADLYSFNHIRQLYDELISIFQALGSACVLLGVLYYLFPDLLLGRGVFFLGVAISGGLVFASRLVLDRAWRAAVPKQRTLIIGTGDLAVTVARELANREDLNICLVGLVAEADSRLDRTAGLFGYPIAGSVDELEAIVERNHVGRIVVALADRRGTLPSRELVRLRVRGVRIEEAQTILTALTGRVWLETAKPSWFIFRDGFHRARRTLIIKRCLDVVFSMLGLILTFPLMALVAIAIRLDSKGPVIYRQTRVGLRGATFDVLKFRSMRIDAEARNMAQWATPNDPRVTRIGFVLRRFRIDELPQFVNVLRGEMSFVGPRPERPYFVEILREQIPYYEERHSVRPGLTGWSQVRYQYGSCVEDAVRKLEYELFYLQNLSILFDLTILFQTLRVMLTGRGAR